MKKHKYTNNTLKKKNNLISQYQIGKKVDTGSTDQYDQSA